MSQSQENAKVLGQLQIAIEVNHQNVGKWIVQLAIDIAKDIDKISALVRNQTEEIKTLKSRQAISGAFQAISLVILCLWLLTLLVRAIFRCVTEKQEEMVEILERSLQERKSKRRAMAKPGPSDK